MIKCWFNIRSGYIIKYEYDTTTDKLKIYRQQNNGLKNLPHYF